MFIFKAGPRKVFRLKPVRCAKKVADPWFRALVSNFSTALNVECWLVTQRSSA